MSDHHDTDLTDPHGEAEMMRAERDAMRATNERLRAELDGFAAANHGQASCIHLTAQALGPDYAATVHALPKAAAHVAARASDAETERDALKAENDRLREFLSEAADILECDTAEIADLENTLSSYRENWRGASVMADRIRAALKGAGHE